MAKVFSGMQSLSFPSTNDLRMDHPTIANRPFGGSLLYALDCGTRNSERIQSKSSQNVSEKRFILTIGQLTRGRPQQSVRATVKSAFSNCAEHHGLGRIRRREFQKP